MKNISHFATRKLELKAFDPFKQLDWKYCFIYRKWKILILIMKEVLYIHRPGRTAANYLWFEYTCFCPRLLCGSWLKREKCPGSSLAFYIEHMHVRGSAYCHTTAKLVKFSCHFVICQLLDNNLRSHVDLTAQWALLVLGLISAEGELFLWSMDVCFSLDVLSMWLEGLWNPKT